VAYATADQTPYPSPVAATDADAFPNTVTATNTILSAFTGAVRVAIFETHHKEHLLRTHMRSVRVGWFKCLRY
jgi:hypothetical protein